jgi:transposase
VPGALRSISRCGPCTPKGSRSSRSRSDWASAGVPYGPLSTLRPTPSGPRVIRSLGSLAPYEPYLQVHWEAGCQNGLQLWHELQAQGFPGSRKPVARWVQQRRVSPAPTTPRKYLHQRQAEPTSASATASLALTRPAVPAPRQLVWLLLREHTRLNAEERAILARIRQDREVEIAYALVQRFRTLVQDRAPAALAPWLSASAASGIPDLQTFAAGLQRDYPAVEAALRETWSTGQLEGQVNRLKLIKRQMYGRANFDLLRQRVLHAA